jgi:hypothetical protein
MWKSSLALLLCVLAGCRGGGIEYREPTGAHISIADLKSRFERAPVAIEGEIYITGRVVGSDQWGAFYKTLVLEDATGGIAVRIDMENYHRTYMRGMLVKVACNSLVLSSYGGVVELSAYAHDQAAAPLLGRIPRERLPAVLYVQSGEDEEVMPTLVTTIGALSPEHVSRMVALDDVQFEEAGQAWCDAAAVEAGVGTDRHVVDRTGRRLIVRTGPYAGFADRLLPVGSGRIEGVIGWFSGSYQIEVCTADHAVMDGARF